MAEVPNELDVLRALVTAHDQRHPRTGDREPIMFLRAMGGSHIGHHALANLPEGVDEAMLEDMHGKGLISIDYRQHNWNITPTAYARQIIDESNRINRDEPTTDLSELLRRNHNPGTGGESIALARCSPGHRRAEELLGGERILATWSAVTTCGLAIPDEQQGLFAATIRALIQGAYLAATGSLAMVMSDEGVTLGQLPGEVVVTDKAYEILDGWPGAAPEELVENLLAVIASAAASKPDPSRKRRLETLGATIRETGVAIASRSSRRSCSEGCTKYSRRPIRLRPSLASIERPRRALAQLWHR